MIVPAEGGPDHPVIEGITVDSFVSGIAVPGVVDVVIAEGSMMLFRSEMDDDIIVTSVSTSSVLRCVSSSFGPSLPREDSLGLEVEVLDVDAVGSPSAKILAVSGKHLSERYSRTRLCCVPSHSPPQWISFLRCPSVELYPYQSN